MAAPHRNTHRRLAKGGGGGRADGRAGRAQGGQRRRDARCTEGRGERGGGVGRVNGGRGNGLPRRNARRPRRAGPGRSRGACVRVTQQRERGGWRGREGRGGEGRGGGGWRPPRAWRVEAAERRPRARREEEGGGLGTSVVVGRRGTVGGWVGGSRGLASSATGQPTQPKKAYIRTDARPSERACRRANADGVTARTCDVQFCESCLNSCDGF